MATTTVCDWAPCAEPATLRLRAGMRAAVRTFFVATGALEVDTPALSTTAPTDPHVEPLVTHAAALGERRLYLQSSPELPMKRLLAVGVGDCWQLARVFRDGERGRLHHPEFDLLEWYRVDCDHRGLMDDTEGLLAAALAPAGLAVPAAERLAYAQAFQRHAGVDPLTASAGELRAAARAGGLDDVAGLDPGDRDAWLDRLLTALVLPRLPDDRPTFIHGWPASQAALARIDAEDPRVAERFELYWGELELANGFHELADAGEQRERFEADNRHRAASGLATIPVDERLLAALEAGLPDCAGVALGFDRLVMLAAGATSIEEVLAFPLERA